MPSYSSVSFQVGTAGLYRRSFQSYREDTLLISSFFYAMCAGFFLGVFLVKYRIELLLGLPFVALLFAWYLKIGMKPDSAAQHPERLYREKLKPNSKVSTFLHDYIEKGRASLGK